MLSDGDIRKELGLGNLLIEPIDLDVQIQPASIDLRLGGTLRKLGRKSFMITRDGYLLRPGQFILGDTIEYMRIPHYLSGQFAGKSSLGRRGLQTHCTAGFVDPGFQGTLTVELSNLSNHPFRLHAGMPIGQLCLYRLTSMVLRPYGSEGLGSHYQHQSGPTPWDRNLAKDRFDNLGKAL